MLFPPQKLSSQQPTRTGEWVPPLLALVFLEGGHMAISVAIQRGNTVFVYDAQNRVLFTKNGKLQGFTSATVSVYVSSNTIYTYDEQGRCISTNYVR